MLKIILFIGSGSFLGGISRFLTTRFIQNSIFSGFPFGTFSVNIIGCLLIGIIYGLSNRGNILSIEWKMFLAVGFCGGFTTFSSFAHEKIVLLKDGIIFHFTQYASLSVFPGIMTTNFRKFEN